MAELGRVAAEVRAAVGKAGGRRRGLARCLHGQGRLVPPRPGAAPARGVGRESRRRARGAPARRRSARLRGRLPRDGRGLHQGARRRLAGPSRSPPPDAHLQRGRLERPSPSPTSSLTRCASRWASSSQSACRRAPRSAVRPPSARCPASRRSAWRRSCPARRPASRSSSRREARRAHRRGFLPDLASRKKLAPARVPKLVDLALDELLSLQPSKLAKKLDGAQVVIVRSQEIDHAGETGFTFQARQVMDTVIDNLARAIRKLAAAGVEHAVVTADHGHLFFAADRDESMRTDAPGGDTSRAPSPLLDRTRRRTPRVRSRVGFGARLRVRPRLRLPVGRASSRPAATSRSTTAGPRLQELVIPVLTVRTKARGAGAPTSRPDGDRPARGSHQPHLQRDVHALARSR
jgi:hypothetical protein